VIAHKTHRTAAQGIGLTIKNVRPSSVLNDNNFIKIMVMLRER